MLELHDIDADYPGELHHSRGIVFGSMTAPTIPTAQLPDITSWINQQYKTDLTLDEVENMLLHNPNIIKQYKQAHSTPDIVL